MTPRPGQPPTSLRARTRRNHRKSPCKPRNPRRRSQLVKKSGWPFHMFPRLSSAPLCHLLRDGVDALDVVEERMDPMPLAAMLAISQRVHLQLCQAPRNPLRTVVIVKTQRLHRNPHRSRVKMAWCPSSARMHRLLSPRMATRKPSLARTRIVLPRKTDLRTQNHLRTRSRPVKTRRRSVKISPTCVSMATTMLVTTRTTNVVLTMAHAPPISTRTRAASRETRLLESVVNPAQREDVVDIAGEAATLTTVDLKTLPTTALRSTSILSHLARPLRSTMTVIANITITPTLGPISGHPLCHPRECMVLGLIPSRQT